MIVAITGGRDPQEIDPEYLVDVTLSSLEITKLVSGNAKGYDTLCEDWAERNGIEIWRFPAKWRIFKNRAGPIRNYEMLKKSNPDLLVAFPGGNGTAHCVRTARKMKIPLLFAKR